MTYPQQPYVQPEYQPIPTRPRRRRVAAVLSTIAVALAAVLVTVALLAQGDDNADDKTTGGTAVGESTTYETTTVPRPPSREPEPATNSWPSASDLSVKLKVTEKQCFGSAGCSVTVQPELAYNGYLDPATFGTYTVTISVSGDESGEVITTLAVTGGDYTVTPLFLSTASGGVAPKAKILSVEE